MRRAWLSAGFAAAAALAAAACERGAAPPWHAAPQSRIDLRSEVSATAVRLLQPFTVTLDLWRADGADVDFAPAVPAADFAATVTTAPERPLFGGHWQRTVLELRPLRGPGELTLPSFAAKLRDGRDAASTPERTIRVDSVLAGAGEAIEAPGEPFPSPFRGWWWLAAGVLALAAGVWWWRARPSRPQAEATLAVAVPPHVRAMRALERLRGASRTTRADVDRWYVDLSQVLRVYVEERFGVRAPERTTEEFLREIETGDGLLQRHREALAGFLSQCDLVKFAGHAPGEADHQVAWSAAAAFVEGTRVDQPAAGGGA
jgi:hypothetical protein